MKDKGREKRNFKQDQKIDRFCLELESETLPGIVKYWSNKYADAKADVRSSENRLAVFTANLEKEKNLAKADLEKEAGKLRKGIRGDPEKFGVKGEALKKLTDTLLESVVVEQGSYQNALKKFEEARAYVASEEYQETKKDLLEAKKRRDYLQGGVKAIEQKGFSINVMKDLLIHGFYFMADKEISEEQQSNFIQNQQNQKITEDINKRNRRQKE